MTVANGTSRVGPLAIELMHHFEACKLKAYRCPAGVWTIGWGDTGPHVEPGLVWTQAQADAAFERRLNNEFAPAVREAAGDATPAQFGAMVALAYNIGVGAFRRSSVARFHKAGNHEAAADAFLMWNKALGRVLPGLNRRRKAERALYRRDFAELARLTDGAVAA
jgi:GH24 family phage-related lysozyme (muramidase)